MADMGYAVLGAWLIQAAVGAALLLSVRRHARRRVPRAIVAHAVLMLLFAAPWLAYVITGRAWWPWIAIGILMVGIPFGETMMVRRARALRGETTPGMRDYGRAVALIVQGRFPRRVAFHALFSAVVFFPALAVAIGATVAA